LRLKTSSKIAAAAIAVVSAAIVLGLDGNWPALVVLSVAFCSVLLWVFYRYREGGRVR